MKKLLACLAVLMLCGLTACRIDSVMRSAKQEKAFREQYVDKPFYTAIVVHPYNYNDEYLIDLTGKVTELDDQTFRSSISVPLGSPITITDIDERHVLASIDGYDRPFRIMVNTERGQVEDVEKELKELLAENSPLDLARPEMRPFIEREQLTQGMSQREIQMSWGHPDRVYGLPGASGFLEHWVYYSRRVNLYLDNGFLTNWQRF